MVWLMEKDHELGFRPPSLYAQHLFLGTVTWCSCLLDSICAGSIFTLGFSTLRKCSLKEWILPNRWDPFPVFPSISHPLVSSTPPKPSKERLELAVEQTCIQICLYHSQALCPSVRRLILLRLSVLICELGTFSCMCRCMHWLLWMKSVACHIVGKRCYSHTIVTLQLPTVVSQKEFRMANECPPLSLHL